MRMCPSRRRPASCARCEHREAELSRTRRERDVAQQLVDALAARLRRRQCQVQELRQRLRPGFDVRLVEDDETLYVECCRHCRILLEAPMSAVTTSGDRFKAKIAALGLSLEPRS